MKEYCCSSSFPIVVVVIVDIAIFVTLYVWQIVLIQELKIAFLQGLEGPRIN
jgi:hypothetical protein